LKKPFRKLVEDLGSLKRLLLLSRLRRKYEVLKPQSVVRYLNNEVRITDGPNFYVQCKDEFVQRIYHFEAKRPDPLIIDGGSNVGMSILYFKSVYPEARIIGFEPDPNIFRLLEENVSRNKLKHVTLVNAGLGAESGTTTFIKDDKAGGQFGQGEHGIIHVHADHFVMAGGEFKEGFAHLAQTNDHNLLTFLHVS